MLVYEVSAFTKEGQGGNKAGVILSENDGNNPSLYQEIAKEKGYSEVIVAYKVDTNLYKVSYYTPSDEIDFCGHASIALGYLLFKEADASSIDLKTNNELVTLYKKDQAIYLKMPDVSYGRRVDKERIAHSLSIDSNQIILQPEIVSVGIPDIMILVDSKNTLDKIVLNRQAVIDISRRYNVTGYHVCAIEKNIYYTRNFAPLYEIDEECATGSASASMYYYLLKHKMLNETSMTFIQGDNMIDGNKQSLASEIKVMVKEEDLYVGGTCVLNQTYKYEKKA